MAQGECLPEVSPRFFQGQGLTRLRFRETALDFLHGVSIQWELLRVVVSPVSFRDDFSGKIGSRPPLRLRPLTQVRDSFLW